MKTAKSLLIINMLLLCLSLTGCRRSSDDVWEDTKTASRHMSRGVRTLGGKNGNSRQIRSRDEFYCEDFDANVCSPAFQNDFIPLADNDSSSEVDMAESMAPAPRENPGDPGSSIPGIEAFRDPNTIPQLAPIFKNIYFPYNSDLIKGEDNLRTMRNIADYMRRNPNTYIFVEGHTDERGPEAFNLALGSRRANAVRNLLISEGVNPDNIFTVSFGKERPAVLEHHEEAWSQNRRAEFKIYQR